MLTREPIFVNRLARKLSRFDWLKRILSKPYYFSLHAISRHRNNKFRKNGVKVLSKFDNCLKENHIPYTLAFGTMLGAVREKGFIKHDFDIDVAIWYDDTISDRLKTILNEYGFKLYHQLSVDGGKCGLEQTFVLDDVSIDVFYIYPAIDDYPYCCDFIGVSGLPFYESMEKYGKIIARRLQMPWSKEYIITQFEGLNLPIQKNAHQFLSFRYGEDYMIPNPKWNYTGKNKYIIVWEEKVGIVDNL